MCTVFLVTTLHYVMVSGVLVIWPPTTRHAFLWNSSILMSNTIWQLTYWSPLCGFLPSGIIWNAIFTCSISFCMASHQMVFPFFLSMTYASFTILGSSIPNSWVLSSYWVLCFLTMEIIPSLFFRTWWTHQLNVGSYSIPWATAYLATWIGYDSLRSESFSHNVDPSFHLQQMSQPAADFLRVSHPFMTIMLIRLSICNKFPNQLLTFSGFLTL